MTLWRASLSQCGCSFFFYIFFFPTHLVTHAATLFFKVSEKDKHFPHFILISDIFSALSPAHKKSSFQSEGRKSLWVSRVPLSARWLSIVASDRSAFNSDKLAGESERQRGALCTVSAGAFCAKLLMCRRQKAQCRHWGRSCSDAISATLAFNTICKTFFIPITNFLQ